MRRVAQLFAPYRIGKMRVIPETGNHMPVQMRHHIAERSEVDLVGGQHFAHCRFGGKYHTHQGLLVVRRQVGHLFYVGVQDNAQKAGVVRFVSQYHSA